MYAQLDQYTLQASQDNGRQIWENMHGGAGYHRDGGLWRICRECVDLKEEKELLKGFWGQSGKLKLWNTGKDY